MLTVYCKRMFHQQHSNTLRRQIRDEARRRTNVVLYGCDIIRYGMALGSLGVPSWGTTPNWKAGRADLVNKKTN